jgi:hypothetical protein
MKSIKNVELKSSLLAIFGVLLSKMCCILPLVGVALGGSAFFEGVKIIAPFMLLGSVLVVSYSWYKYMKPQNCNCVSKKKKKRNTLFISSALLAVLLFTQLIFPLLQPVRSHNNASITDFPMCHTRN